MLSDSPFRTKETSSVEMLVFLKEVAIGDPEDLESHVSRNSQFRELGRRTPSFPNLCPNFSIHCGVHCSEPSLHAPLHSFFPHGFLGLVSLFLYETLE